MFRAGGFHASHKPRLIGQSELERLHGCSLVDILNKTFTAEVLAFPAGPENRVNPNYLSGINSASAVLDGQGYNCFGVQRCTPKQM